MPEQSQTGITILHFLFCIKLWLMVEIAEAKYNSNGGYSNYLCHMFTDCMTLAVTRQFLGQRTQFPYGAHNASLIFKITSSLILMPLHLD
jgi:hypothetical protein